jgi:hypothetical protein
MKKIIKAQRFSWSGFIEDGQRFDVKKNMRGKMFMVNMEKNKDGTYKYFEWVPLKLKSAKNEI